MPPDSGESPEPAESLESTESSALDTTALDATDSQGTDSQSTEPAAGDSKATELVDAGEPSSGRSPVFVVVLVVWAAFVGSLGGTEITSMPVVDAVYRVCGAVVVALGVRELAPSWRLGVSGIVLAAVAGPIGFVAAGCSTLLNLGLLVWRPLKRLDDDKFLAVAAHLSAAQIVVALFALFDRWFQYSATLVAALVGGVALAVGLRVASRPVNKRLVWSAVAVVSGLVLLAGLYGFQVWGKANRLVAVAEQVVADGDSANVEPVATELASVRSAVDRWWFAPLEAVPGLAQNVRAVRQTVVAADETLEAAAELAAVADRSDSTPELLANVGDSLGPACENLVDLNNAIESASSSGYLLPLVGGMVGRVESEMARFGSGIELCPMAAHFNTVLGFSGERTYLVLFTNTAEGRAVGGLVTNWAVVKVADGRFTPVQSGRAVPLNDRLLEVGASLELPEDTASLWGQFEPERYFQDVGLSPDGAFVADSATELFSQAYPQVQLDGTLVAGPEALAGLLALGGEPEGAGSDTGASDDSALDSENAVEFLTQSQYELDLSYGERVGLLSELLDSGFAQFESVNFDTASEGASRLLRAVDSGELLFVPADSTVRESVATTSLAGHLPEAELGQLVGLVEQNAGMDKLDVYLEREAKLSWAGGQDSSASLRLEYQNDAPEDLPEYVLGLDHGDAPERVNRRRVSVYAPVHATSAAVVDGELSGSLSKDGSQNRNELEVFYGSEAGHQVSTFVVDVLPGEQTIVDVEFANWSAPQGELQVLRPPSLNPGSIGVEVGSKQWLAPPQSRLSTLELD